MTNKTIEDDWEKRLREIQEASDAVQLHSQKLLQHTNNLAMLLKKTIVDKKRDKIKNG